MKKFASLLKPKGKTYQVQEERLQFATLTHADMLKLNQLAAGLEDLSIDQSSVLDPDVVERFWQIVVLSCPELKELNPADLKPQALLQLVGCAIDNYAHQSGQKVPENVIELING